MSQINLKNILDVTLRDGGYLNKWQFSDADITNLLNFLTKQGLQHVEIGFLQPTQSITSSVNGCPVEFLQKLKQEHPDIHLVGMLNPAEENWREAVQGKLEYLSLVRLTCTAELVDKALIIAEYLHAQASHIQVSMNLICISSYQHEEVATLVRKIAQVEQVDRLYFADSRGALLPQEIAPLFALAKQHCDKPLGFHAHDTLGNAIENSNQAFASGCDLIDVSLNGFGLAGGNTPLAGYLIHNKLAPADLAKESQIFCTQDFPLREKDMGDRPLFKVLANKNVDPIWSDKLLNQYPKDLHEQINGLPRKPYKTLPEVINHLQNAHSFETIA